MKHQKGFSIIMAIFILVVLSLLGGYMVKLSGVQNATAVNAIQGARAYQAARSAVEWSIAKIITPAGDCRGVTDVSSLTSLTEVTGFKITLSFIYPPIHFSEGQTSFTAYKINSKSELGRYENTGYISRTVEMSIACINP